MAFKKKIQSNYMKKIFKERQDPIFKFIKIKNIEVKFLENFDNVFLKISDLGEGGFGTVTSYSSHIYDKPVAIKKIFDEESMIDSIEKEVIILKEMNGNSVVKYFDSFASIVDNKKCYCVVMELISGMSLEDYIEKNEKKIKPDSAIKFALWMYETLSYIHELGWVHSDIKPDNIMIDEKNDRFVLIDFGLSCFFKEKKLRVSCNPEGNGGTIDYFSPELLDRSFIRKADHSLPDSLKIFEKSDVWAASMTIYSLLHRGIPWSGRNTYDAKKIILDKKTFLNYTYKDDTKILSNLKEAISMGLQKSPDLRPSSTELANYIQNN